MIFFIHTAPTPWLTHGGIETSMVLVLGKVLGIGSKVASCQKIWCGSKKYSKSLSWKENLDLLPIKVKTKQKKKTFKFSAQDCDLAYIVESHQTFWQKLPWGG